MKQETYEARYVYRHFNGSDITYQFMTTKGIWQGYINESATRQ